MASPTVVLARRGILRAPGHDEVLIALTLAHAALFLAAPVLPVIALGLWWNSNTISHNFIHRPFFRRRRANKCFAAGLTLLLGIPQSLWRDRHLAHHAGIRPHVRFSAELLAQCALVVGLWAVIAVCAPVYFFSVYVPGYLLGLALCALHGYYEHAGGATSYYGRLYNLMFCNDGYHVEHHANPAVHWTCLPGRRDAAARRSAWPAPLRWIEDCNLDTLERLTLRLPFLQSFVVRVHERALRAVLAASGTLRPRHVGIVGGGLFPRTALILRRLLPDSRLTIIDASSRNIDCARRLLRTTDVEFHHHLYTGGGDFDLVVLPLAFRGDRAAICARPPACGLMVHDWIWRKWGAGRIVSLALLKRVYLVRP
jgi:Fatty acid desaturase